MNRKHILLLILPFLLLATSCKDEGGETPVDTTTESPAKSMVDKYATVRLEADLSGLTENQKAMLPLLIQAGEIMNECFWYEAYGDQSMLLGGIEDMDTKRFAEINYGPWDRLADNAPFVDGVGEKPAGSNYYPADITKEEFEAADLPNKTSQYTFIRRDESGALIEVPYHEQFADQVKRASALLLQAADLAEDAGLKNYLTLRADALLTDDYQPSDLAWMDMKDNTIDVVIGPIETYEDQLYGYKASHECYVLIKDQEWSGRLAKYVAFLPELQEGLPVSDEYKQDKPGRDADLNAYDVVYYAGDCNAGSKTIAINLPNDEEVQVQKGTRRLQLKNAMRAKFDQILVPLSTVLIAEDQRGKITFDAFFSNTMFHEVAHGLGVKNTLDGEGTVRNALKEHSSALEEGKADILGLYMIMQLHEKGEVEGNLEDYYITFVSSIFRSIRFGASSAHGKANMIRFNFFMEQGAIIRDETSGTYSVDIEKIPEAVRALSELILTIQGDGDYDRAAQLIAEKGVIGEQLQADLDRLSDQSIPVDIVFEQGANVLGL